MTQELAVKYIEQIDKKMLDIFKSKSADYADQDPLSNFKIVSKVVELLKIDTTTPEGYALLMVILKICRIGNLLSSNKTPNNESIEDSFMDGINYFKLALLCYKDKPVLQVMVESIESNNKQVIPTSQAYNYDNTGVDPNQ